MLNRILKDKELTNFLMAMVEDGCDVSIQAQTDISRYFQGFINHSELMELLADEWNFQKNILKSAH